MEMERLSLDNLQEEALEEMGSLGEHLFLSLEMTDPESPRPRRRRHPPTALEYAAPDMVIGHGVGLPLWTESWQEALDTSTGTAAGSLDALEFPEQEDVGITSILNKS